MHTYRLTASVSILNHAPAYAMIYLLTSLLLTGCGGGDSESEQLPVDNENCTPTQLETELLEAHNQARSQARLCDTESFSAAPALQWNCTLAEISHQHSNDMAQNDFFDHTGSDGLTAFDRMTNAGYSYSYAGENIAAGQQDVATVIEAWLNSPGHCRNIMNKNFTQLGAARVDSSLSSSTYGIYWTVDFGTPR